MWSSVLVIKQPDWKNKMHLVHDSGSEDQCACARVPVRSQGQAARCARRGMDRSERWCRVSQYGSERFEVLSTVVVSASQIPQCLFVLRSTSLWWNEHSQRIDR